MAINNRIDLPAPTESNDFEHMCCDLLNEVHSASQSFMVLGRSGQNQGGLDIIGWDNEDREIGVQCRRYSGTTKLTYSAMRDDVKAVTESEVDPDLMIFATSLTNSVQMARDARKINTEREFGQKFNVTIWAWDKLSNLLLQHQNILRRWLPDPYGSLTPAAEGRTEAQTIASAVTNALRPELARAIQGNSPIGSGAESDPQTAVQLDQVKSFLEQERTEDAAKLLEKIGPPSRLKDQRSVYRWKSNSGTVACHRGDFQLAADYFEEAYKLYPEEAYATINWAHAAGLKGDMELALERAEASLSAHGEDSNLWSLIIQVRLELGRENPDSGLPASLQSTSPIRFAQARIAEGSGDIQTALLILDSLIEDEKYGRLAAAFHLSLSLEWAQRNRVQSFNGMLLPGIKEALVKSVRSFEPFSSNVYSLQTERSLIEISNNLMYALLLLGQEGRAKTLADAISDQIFLEAADRVRVEYFLTKNDDESIAKLTTPNLDRYTLPFLMWLSDIAFRSKDHDWLTTVNKASENNHSPRTDFEKAFFSVVKARLVELSGDVQGALNLINHILTNPDQDEVRVLLAGERIRLFTILADHQSAEAEATELFKIAVQTKIDYIPEHVSSVLQDMGKYQQAAELLKNIVSMPGNDPLTRRLLTCLAQYHSGQNEAVGIIDELDDEVKNTPFFLRIQAEIARSHSDWVSCVDIFEKLRSIEPDNVHWWVSAVQALYMATSPDQRRINDILSKDPHFDSSPWKLEMSLAQLQIDAGFHEEGLRRAYITFRDRPNSLEVAAAYKTATLNLPANLVPELQAAGKAGNWYTLSHAEGEIHVVEDICETTSTGDSWPELLPNGDSYATKFQNLNIDQKVPFKVNGARGECILKSSASAFEFAIFQVLELSERNASPDPVLKTVKVVDEDGNHDFSELFEELEKIREANQNYAKLYLSNPLSLYHLSKITGRSAAELWFQWPSLECNLYVAPGFGSDREEIRREFQDHIPACFDLFTLLELWQYGVLEKVFQTIKKPIVSTSVIADLRVNSATFSLGTTASVYDSVLALIGKHCKVLSHRKVYLAPNQQDLLSAQLPNGALHTIYVAAEADAILLSADQRFRALVDGTCSETGIQSRSVQSILYWLVTCDVISKDEYFEVLIAKARNRHFPVYFEANEIIEQAIRTPNKLHPNASFALKYYSNTDWVCDYVASIFTEFAKTSVSALPATIVFQYFNVMLDALGQHDEKDSLRAEYLLRLGTLEGIKIQETAVSNRAMKILKPIVAPIPAMNRHLLVLQKVLNSVS